MDTKLRKAKNDFKKYFFKLMNNFWKDSGKCKKSQRY